jgi:hypothetical protein
MVGQLGLVLPIKSSRTMTMAIPAGPMFFCVSRTKSVSPFVGRVLDDVWTAVVVIGPNSRSNRSEQPQAR